MPLCPLLASLVMQSILSPIGFRKPKSRRQHSENSFLAISQLLTQGANKTEHHVSLFSTKELGGMWHSQAKPSKGKTVLRKVIVSRKASSKKKS